YCKAKKEKLENLKELCKNCASSGSSCERDDIEGTQCEACKKTCREYKNFVQLWQEQFETQSKIYNELYEKENKNSGSFNNVLATYGSKRNPITLQDYDNKRTYNFLKKVKNKCADDAKTAEQYLDKTTKCIPYKFTNNNNNDDDTYAFKEKPPNKYEQACDCKAPDPLEQCPKDKDVYDKACKNVSAKNILCHRKTFKDDLDNWNSYLVREWSGKNKGVLMPPRRRHLCTSVISLGIDRKMEYNNFMNKFLSAAYTEGLLLAKKYPGANNEGLQAMKYSFYDYGDIIKGTDMMDTTITTDIKTTLENILINKQNNLHSSSTSNEPKNVNDWWEHNKKKVWHAMLCGYQKENKSKTLDNAWCILPTEDNTDQFLRWLIEWSEQACKEQKIRKNYIDRKRNSLISDSTQKFGLELLKDHSCNKELTTYIGWIEMVKKSLEGFNIKFQKIKDTSNSSSISENSAEEYIKSKIHDNHCNFIDIKNTYDQITNSKDNDFQEILGKLFPNLKFEEDTSKRNEDTKPSNSQQEEDPTSHPLSPIQPDNSPIPSHPISPQSKDDPILPMSNILSSALPLGISFVLGSIALLFYMKKKPKTPVDIFRVLDIPQNDYGMPDETSTNRYVPYGKYKGRTYIYVENDTDDDKYMFTSDTTDVTSSESEFEEIDINDIYKPFGPKYKTLIEVVLKPSTNNNVQDTYTDDVKDNSDKPINKLTDEEWNELKQDFISQYLQNIPKDLPNENIIDDNMYKDTQPNILDVSNEEKPFITSIQDRKLYSDDNEIIYNIDWNVPKHTTDIPKYNSLYSGTDLINDALNSGNDIYDELLKRKENELFGTKHPKNSSTNSVVKQIGGDPINNQIDLFHKWLDRHRNICNKWNNKEEMLNQLNEEWKNENNEHILDTSSTHDDINKNNDENYNMISTNTQINHEGNDITSLEDFGSTNIPYSDLITQNNDSQRKHLRTNISMDIHFDENNNNNNVLITDVTHEEDHLENMYNF
ncbi:putative EMP1-like protein, partial [Plasmodium gaboni]